MWQAASHAYHRRSLRRLLYRLRHVWKDPRAVWSHWASLFGRSEHAIVGDWWRCFKAVLPWWHVRTRDQLFRSLLWSLKSTKGHTFLKLLYVPTRIYRVNIFPHIFPMSGAYIIFNAQLLDDHVEWNVNHVGYALYWRMQNSAEYVVNTLFWVGMV